MKMLVLHGPNLNLFGRREPHIYGTTTLAEIDGMLSGLAAELKVDIEILQSNHEGELVDFLHRNIDTASGAIVNPAGLTQHGVSLHDAIKAMPFPVLEVGSDLRSDVPPHGQCCGPRERHRPISSNRSRPLRSPVRPRLAAPRCRSASRALARCPGRQAR